MYACRCGAQVELPHGSIEVFTNQGDGSFQLCALCTVEVIEFVRNQPTRRIVMSDHNPNPKFTLIRMEIDDDEIDDLSLPIIEEDEVSEDWLRERRRVS